MDTVYVPALVQIANPFRDVIWHLDIDRPITVDEVVYAIRCGDFLTTPWEEGGLMLGGDPVEKRMRHIRRIAFFVQYGWVQPIMVDVGVPGYYSPDYPITDGNHRLGAAIIRGEFFIEASVAGDLDHVHSLNLDKAPPPGWRPGHFYLCDLKAAAYA